MDDAGAVGGAERLTQLADDLPGQVRGQWARRCQKSGEWFALGPLQREVVQALRFAVFVGPDDVGVTHARAELRFAQETLHRDGILTHASAQYFDGGETSLRMLRTIDGRRSTLADM